MSSLLRCGFCIQTTVQHIYRIAFHFCLHFSILTQLNSRYHISMPETKEHLPEGLQELIQGCILKERQAQARLYNFYCDRMMGVCLWYAKSREEAEEILQEGFVRVFTYIKTYSGEGNFEGWMKRIMINAALQRYRDAKSQRLYLVDYNPNIHDESQSVWQASNCDEKQVLALINQLPPMYRIVFSLYVLEGFKHKEIAARLGISEGTSKSNLANARAILQKKIYGLHKTVV